MPPTSAEIDIEIGIEFESPEQERDTDPDSDAAASNAVITSRGTAIIAAPSSPALQ